MHATPRLPQRAPPVPPSPPLPAFLSFYPQVLALEENLTEEHIALLLSTCKLKSMECAVLRHRSTLPLS